MGTDMPVSNPPKSRQRYWDTSRAFLMLLGIPLHASLLYAVHIDWAVSATSSNVLFDWIYLIIHSFRMQAFFIVAGFFAGMLLVRKEAGAWLKSRVIRIGAPLIAGVILINPFQMLITAAAGLDLTLATHGDVRAELLKEITTSGIHWLRHFWFLVVLLELSALLAFAHSAWPKLAYWRPGERVSSLVSRNPVPSLLVAAVLIAAVSIASVIGMSFTGFNNHRILGMLQLRNTLIFAPFFLLGAFLSRDSQILERFVKPIPAVWLGAGVSIPAYAASTLLIKNQHIQTIAELVSSSFAGLFMAHVVLSACKKWYDKPNPIIDRLVLGSMAIYVLHQPIIGVLGMMAFYVDAPIFVEFLAICLLTLALAYVGYVVVDKSRILSLFFNGSIKSRAPEERSLRGVQLNQTPNAD